MKKFMEGKYREWHESNPVFNRMYEEKIKILNEFCDETKSILEIGCYDDRFWDKIKYKEFHMVDIKLNDVKYHQNCFYYELEGCDFLRKCLDNNMKFDVIIMTNLMEHLENPRPLLKLIGKSLNEGGVWINSFPNGRSPTRLLGVELGMLNYPEELDYQDYEYDHFHMYGMKHLKTMTKASGLSLIDVRGIMFKPLPLSMMNKYFANDLDKFIEIGNKIGPHCCGDIVGIWKKD